MYKGRIDSVSKHVTIDEVVGHDESLKIDGKQAMIVPEDHPLYSVLEKYNGMLRRYGEYFAYEFDTILAEHRKTHKEDLERQGL